MAARSRDGETLVVEQPLDLQNPLHIFAAIEAVSLGTFHRLQHGKFGFPIAQHKWLGVGQAADFADAEEDLLPR